MAISRVLGTTINNAVAGTSLAFSSQTLTNGQFVVICVAILNTGVSVSGISDTSANVYTFRGGINSGSAVRSEIWTCPVTASTAGRVITVTLSGSSLASASFEEYAGVSSLGNIGTGASGTSFYPEGDVATQDGNNWSICSIAVATNSGDTFSTNLGAITQSIIPALTTAASGLIDNSSVGVSVMRNSVRLSTSRTWAAIALELRSGSGVIGFTSQKIIAPITTANVSAKHQRVTAPLQANYLPTHYTPTPVAQELKGGMVGVGYAETITANNGTAPFTYSLSSGSLPTGTALTPSTGLISGTPSTAASYSFVIQVSDVNSFTGTQAFSIAIAGAGTKPNSGFSF